MLLNALWVDVHHVPHLLGMNVFHFLIIILGVLFSRLLSLGESLKVCGGSL